MLLRGEETAVDTEAAATSCGIRVKHYGSVRGRYFPVYMELAGSQRFGVHNNSMNNGRRALVERVFRYRDAGGQLVPPPPCSADVPSRLRRFTRSLRKHMYLHRPVTRQAFADMYSGRRRDVYVRAVEDLARRPFTKGDSAIAGAFVKCEKINFSAKHDPAPRAIQPRTPRYNVEVGRYLKPLEHGVYEAIAQVFGGPTVMKGLSAEGVAKELRGMWDQFSVPVAVGLDASRFDQHVRAEMLRWEHSVYEGCFLGCDRDELRKLLHLQLHNKGYMRCDDGILKYQVYGSRMSGDMNTSLGNCLIMCALVFTLAEERGIKVRLANNGDDCVVVMEARDVETFNRGLKEWFWDFGFNMKVEAPVDEFEGIEFCQSHPVWDGQCWIMVRNPLTTLSKDACAVVRDFGHGTGARKWLWAVGECGMRMAGGIPVVQEHYAAFLRHGVRGLGYNPATHETGMYFLAQGLQRGYKAPTDDARVSFYKAFGLSATHQVELEARLRSVAFRIPDSPCIGTSSAGKIPL